MKLNIIKDIIIHWFQEWTPDPYIRKKVLDNSLEGCKDRAIFLNIIFAFAFVIYGPNITPLLQKFDPNITILDNTIPRILFNGIPFALLAFWLKYSNISNKKKLIVWIFSFDIIHTITGWIYVWPLTLKGYIEILPFINASNTFILGILFVILSPPNRYVPFFIISYLATFWANLLVVSIIALPNVYTQVIVGDLIQALIISAILGSIVNKLRVKLITTELAKQKEAEKYLGKIVSKAIFELEEDLLNTRKKFAFLLNMDIRGFTELSNYYDETLIKDFLNGHNKNIINIINKYDGYIHKAMGDGHLISFGLVEEDVDLDGIEDSNEAINALKRHNLHLIEHAIKAADEIITGAHLLGQNIFNHKKIKLGAAIEYGEISIGILGDDNIKKELDIFGDTINRCARLEAHTKMLYSNFDDYSSLLIISPYAKDFLEMSRFKNTVVKLDRLSHPVRDFPNIKTLYVREIKNNITQKSMLNVA